MLLVSISAANASSFTTSQNSLNCLIYQDLSFYDLRALASTTDYSISDGTNTYYFNLCSYTQDQCNSSQSVYAYFNDSSDSCTALSDDDPDSVSSTVVSDSSNIDYISIEYSNGDVCVSNTTTDNSTNTTVDNSIYYSVIIQAYCDPNGTSSDALSINSINTTNTCQPTINVSHYDACPEISASAGFSYIYSHTYLLSPLLIILGALIALFGQQFFTYTIAFLGFLAGALSTYVLFAFTTMLDSIINSDATTSSSTLYFWFKILVSLLMGIFIAFIMCKMQYIAAAVIGALIGSVIGVGIYQLIHWENTEFLVFCVLLFVILMGILTYKFYDHIIIVFTSCIGTYAFVRGWSLIFGKFPNEY